MSQAAVFAGVVMALVAFNAGAFFEHDHYSLLITIPTMCLVAFFMGIGLTANRDRGEE